MMVVFENGVILLNQERAGSATLWYITFGLIWSDGKTTTTAVSEPRTPGTQKYCGRVFSVTKRQLVNPDYTSGRKWLSLKMARTLHKSKK